MWGTTSRIGTTAGMAHQIPAMSKEVFAHKACKRNIVPPVLHNMNSFFGSTLDQAHKVYNLMPVHSDIKLRPARYTVEIRCELMLKAP